MKRTSMKFKNQPACNCLAGAALLALAATLPAQADNYQSALVSQNPVGYWRLDETVLPLSCPSLPRTSAN